MDLYSLYEIRDRITCATSYYNFCSIFNISFNKKNKIIFDKNTNFDIFSDEFIYYMNFDLKYIFLNFDLSDDFVIKYNDQIDWISLSNEQLKLEFIEKYFYFLNLEILLKNTKLPCFLLEKIIKNHPFWNDDFYDIISETQDLNENFLDKFQDDLNWDYISRFQYLNEKIINKFREFINYDLIDIIY